MKKSKTSPFPDLCLSYLNKVYITNSSCKSHKSRYFKIYHEVLKNKVQKCMILWNLLGSSYKISAYKKSQICLSFTLCL